MKSLFNRLAGVAIVAAVLYSCASIALWVVRLCRVRSIIAGKK